MKFDLQIWYLAGAISTFFVFILRPCITATGRNALGSTKESFDRDTNGGGFWFGVLFWFVALFSTVVWPFFIIRVFLRVLFGDSKEHKK